MATVLLTTVISSTPKKLNTAAMRMALFGPMARVETQVAMALGASVQPLTRITPRVRTTVTASAGLCASWLKNSENPMVISSSRPKSERFCPFRRHIYPFMLPYFGKFRKNDTIILPKLYTSTLYSGKIPV